MILTKYTLCTTNRLKSCNPCLIKQHHCFGVVCKIYLVYISTYRRLKHYLMHYLNVQEYPYLFPNKHFDQTCMYNYMCRYSAHSRKTTCYSLEIHLSSFADFYLLSYSKKSILFTFINPYTWVWIKI